MTSRRLSLGGRRGRLALAIFLAIALLDLVFADQRTAPRLTSSGTAEAAQAKIERQAVYITQTTVRLARLIDRANDEGYQLLNNDFSMGGGWLRRDKDNWVPIYTIPMVRGKRYRVVAAGDNDALDVDVSILDPQKKEVASDTKTSSEAEVDFEPKGTADYQVRLRLYDSKEDNTKAKVPCVCLAVVMVK